MRRLVTGLVVGLAVLIAGCGSQSGGSTAGGGDVPLLTPPALPARFLTAVDPLGGDNEDVSSAEDLTFRVSLQPGWNALVFQVDYVTRISAGPEVLGFTTYERGAYLDPQPLTTDTVNRGEGTSLGFFVYASQATVLEYRGRPHQGVAFAGLEPGWNLVAPPVSELDSLQSVPGPVFEVNAQGDPLPAQGAADPGLPLWVYTESAALLTGPQDADTSVTPISGTGPEVPLSERDYPGSDYHCDARPSLSGVRPLATQTGKRWAPGQTLNVLFCDGNNVPDSVYENTSRLVRQGWEASSSLRFHFYKGSLANRDRTYHIRVRFLADQGYNSNMGVDSLLQPDRPSMHLSRLHTIPYNTITFHSVVLHEFGHALGMIHEHQSPNARINWNRPEVYRILGGAPDYWTREQVDFAMFETQDSDLASIFDPKSVMMYRIEKTLTTDGFSVEESPRLSPIDRETTRRAYP
ncbi:hypothetical protein ABS71_03505 [bacterium SCN 62-11]|nr:hypothetical protein [Candidatus Eremiobacteraeota bacterium]ODT76379.1 MAG: hypothetical protein ABS71_03505 [bacterium SCN 62-11]